MAPASRKEHVSHLGGITVSYRASNYDAQKPTLVLVHSFMTSTNLYKAQFDSESITSTTNLVAVDLLGHGNTSIDSGVEQFTYWDSAVMILQLLEKLKIDKYFALGTSQGGWIVVRMALLAPSRLLGIIPLGTSMDFESQRTRDLGCWNVFPIGNSLIDGWTSNETTDAFQLDDEYCQTLANLGIGCDANPELVKDMIADTKSHYLGDLGRRKARMSAINLRDRDGLHGRLSDVVCPVLWLHGTADVVYSVANAKEEIKMLVNSKKADLEIVENGQHFLSASHPAQVEPKVVSFIKQNH